MEEFGVEEWNGGWGAGVAEMESRKQSTTGIGASLP